MDNQEIDQIELDRELVSRFGLPKFCELAWSITQNTRLDFNWHLEVICERLEALYNRDIRKLIMNVPPGTGKTVFTGVLYPAWVWTLHPQESFIFASFDQTLMNNAARAMRDIVASEWFQKRWPNCKMSYSDIKKAEEFRNRKGGWRFSTSVGGRGIGRHPNQRCIDDPIKPLDTQGAADVTKGALKQCEQWYDSTISTRQADPETTVDLLTMQRLHDGDLSGKLVERWGKDRGFEHLMLPMYYEKARAYSYDRRTEEGELLWPSRFTAEIAAAGKATLGEFADAQYQQNPVATEGAIFKREWIKFWSPGGTIKDTVALPLGGIQLQSWDCSFKGDEASDPCCGGVIKRHGGRFFVTDVEWDRFDFPALLEAVRRLIKRNPRVIRKLVEDKANGPAVVATLQEEFPGFEEITPEGGKEARAHSAAPIMKAGLFFLPHPTMYPWVEPALQELTRFPRGIHDDFVDMVTQAIIELHVGSSKLGDAMEALKNPRPQNS